MLKKTLKTVQSDIFCPANSPKHKDYSFAMVEDKEKGQILTFMKPEPENVLTFLHKKMTKTIHK